MDYRMELFRLMKERHDLRFFFMAPNPELTVADAAISERGVIRIGLNPAAMTMSDLRTMVRGIADSNVFVSSFLVNAYTIVGALIARLWGRKVVVWEEIQWLPDTGKGRLKRRVLQCLAMLPHAYFVLGKIQRAALLELGVTEDRIFVANEYPGVDYSTVGPIELPIDVPPDAPCLLYLGRLLPIKGVDVLLRAFVQTRTRRPDAYLLLAGDGPQRSELESLVQSLALTEAVRFIGFVAAPERKAWLFRRATAIVVPSVRINNHSEGGPLVVPEALSAGLPVVGSDALGSSTEMIVPGCNGWIVPERDISGLASAMCEALARPPDRMKVRKTFEALGDHEHQACELERALQFVTKNGRDPTSVSP